MAASTATRILRATGWALATACALAPVYALGYLALALRSPQIEVWHYRQTWLAPLLLGALLALGLAPRRLLGAVLGRLLTIAPCLLSPLALIFPWHTVNEGRVLPAGPSSLLRWLRYPMVGDRFNHDALAQLLCLLGAALAPVLFAVLWLRGARQAGLLAVLLLGLLAWVPGVVSSDDSLVTFWRGGARDVAFFAGPLLRAVPIALMVWFGVLPACRPLRPPG